MNIIAFGLTIYFYPVKEVMFCNEKLECRVKHEFLGNFSFISGFKLDSDSHLDLKIKQVYTRGCSRCSGFALTAKFGQKKPFIAPLSSFRDMQPAVKSHNTEYLKFRDYIKEPSKGYSLKSSAEYSHAKGHFKVTCCLMFLISAFLLRNALLDTLK